MYQMRALVMWLLILLVPAVAWAQDSLSNFAETPFYFHGKRYASVAGFQFMMSYPEGAGDPRRKDSAIWKYTREQVAAMAGSEAKAAGELAARNNARVGVDWVTFEGRRLTGEECEQLLAKAIREKVRQNRAVERTLLSTPDPAGVYAEIRRALQDGTGLPPTERYPAHWWTPVPESGKPDWEVLPQAAKPGEVILSKRNELGILSNFAATPFTLHGKRYASVEGFWQMMLYPEGPDDPRARFPGITWAHTREQVANMTAFEAKRAGSLAEENMKVMGIDWVTFDGKRMKYRSKEKGEHHRLIVEAMRAKVEQNPTVKDILLSTGDLTLLPDHFQEPDPPAEWQYFKIWMEIRGELQAVA